MHLRTAYVVSGALHGVLIWALASSNAALRVDFAVRSGQAFSEVSQSARAQITMIPLDSRMEADAVPEVTLPAPEFPSISEQPASPPPPTTLDDRYVERPPIEELIQRQTDRAIVAVVLPDAHPLPLNAQRDTPQAEGRLRDPLWTAVPSQETPLPDRTIVNQETTRRPLPTTVADVTEPGDAKVNAVGANAPQGAQVDRLPRSLPQNREPAYPEELRRRRIGGRVILEVTIGPDGAVQAVTVARSSGQSLLDQSAVSAVRNWKFEPARRNGKPVSFAVQLPINFTIRG